VLMSFVLDVIRRLRSFGWEFDRSRPEESWYGDYA
jgi:hypothetical protein